MLPFLGQRPRGYWLSLENAAILTGNDALSRVAAKLEGAVDAAYGAGRPRHWGLGGNEGTVAIRDAVLSNL